MVDWVSPASAHGPVHFMPARPCSTVAKPSCTVQFSNFPFDLFQIQFK
jgi:hypothetical protein